jgi:hypothetical protein
LPNLDLTYIRREIKLFYVLPPIENLLHESFFILYFFFHPPTYGVTPMATTIRARIYARGEVSFAKFLFLQVVLPNCWRSIFLILPKLDGCQVDLTNCLSCSNIAFDWLHMLGHTVSFVVMQGHF